MNGRNSYVIVGAFVSIGVVALLYLILSLAGDGSTEKYQRYTIQFDRDISGLTLGAPVRYLGVGVGEVVDIRLTNAGDAMVRVDVEVFESTPISNATFASLAFQGVTGVAFISLAADPDMAIKRQVPEHSEHPIIATRDVGLAAVLSEAPEISHRIVAILDRIARMLDDDNIEALSGLLANVEGITYSLAGRDDALASLPENLDAALGQIEQTFARVQTTIDRAEPELMATLEQLNSASANIAEISTRLDGWLAANDRDMNQFFSGGLGQTAELIADARSTIRELEKLLTDLRGSPSQIVYRPQRDAVAVEP